MLWVLAWVITGISGYLLGCYIDKDKVTVGDWGIISFCAGIGPLTFMIVGVMFLIEYLKQFGDLNKIVIIDFSKKKDEK